MKFIVDAQLPPALASGGTGDELTGGMVVPGFEVALEREFR